MSFEENIKKNNIVLPNAADPVGAYVAAKIVNNLLYISGQISMDENGKLIKKIGNMQKAVVLYRPLPKLLETLRKSGLAKFVKIDKKLKDSKNVEEVKTK